jgi:hypothetical protein
MASWSGALTRLRETQTLSTFFIVVLGKKYTNPSSDIITVLAGLDQIDTVFTEFVGALDSIIRNGKSSEWHCRMAVGPDYPRTAYRGPRLTQD